MKRTLSVLVAAMMLVPALAIPAYADEHEPGNIVEVALAVNAETGEFDTLIAAVVGADLVDALAADGKMTVFAPTDAAFAELGLDETNIVDALGVETLTEILLYHVHANGNKTARKILQRGGGMLPMLNGGKTLIAVGETVTVNQANVVLPDVIASNGVIHVIDSVLLP